MMGFLASNCERYVCCEPSTKSAEGLRALRDTFSYVGKSIEVNCECAEDYIPQKGAFDMAFTSPPYFNTEKYSDEDTQSFKRYPTYEKWMAGFLEPMICNCRHGLKNNGYLLLNVADTKTAPTLEHDSVEKAKCNGFKHVDTLFMVLSSIAGKGIKTEPIFVFEKV